MLCYSFLGTWDLTSPHFLELDVGLRDPDWAFSRPGRGPVDPVPFQHHLVSLWSVPGSAWVLGPRPLSRQQLWERQVISISTRPSVKRSQGQGKSRDVGGGAGLRESGRIQAEGTSRASPGAGSPPGGAAGTGLQGGAWGRRLGVLTGPVPRARVGVTEMKLVEPRHSLARSNTLSHPRLWFLVHSVPPPQVRAEPRLVPAVGCGVGSRGGDPGGRPHKPLIQARAGEPRPRVAEVSRQFLGKRPPA